VEGGGRHGQIEGRFLQAPLLERPDVHFRLRIRLAVAAGDGGQVPAELDAENPVAVAGEGHGGLARAAPYLEYPPPAGIPESETTASKNSSG
jgi:hypothetical protein